MWLVGVPRVAEDEGGTWPPYGTSNSRTAYVGIRPVEEGAVQVRFAAEGKRRWERLGVALEVTADEGFYGLTARPLPGLLHEFFLPPTARSNLRGHEVGLYVLPTHALRNPFFVSSRGWGPYVESSWLGDLPVRPRWAGARGANPGHDRVRGPGARLPDLRRGDPA